MLWKKKKHTYWKIIIYQFANQSSVCVCKRRRKVIQYIINSHKQHYKHLSRWLQNILFHFLPLSLPTLTYCVIKMHHSCRKGVRKIFFSVFFSCLLVYCIIHEKSMLVMLEKACMRARFERKMRKYVHVSFACYIGILLHHMFNSWHKT